MESNLKILPVAVCGVGVIIDLFCGVGCPRVKVLSKRSSSKCSLIVLFALKVLGERIPVGSPTLADSDYSVYSLTSSPFNAL